MRSLSHIHLIHLLHTGQLPVRCLRQFTSLKNNRLSCFTGPSGWFQYGFKGIVHSLKGYVLAYLKGIQDVGVFVYAVFSILIFLGQTVIMEVYGHHLKEHAQRSPNET